MNPRLLLSALATHAAFVIALLSAHPCSAANPRAGLPPVPELLSSDQLQAAFTNQPIAEVRLKAEAGNKEAQAFLGYSYLKGDNVPKDPKLAVDFLRRAADHGLALAQNGLGFCYWDGQGVPKDIKQAEQWFKRAAEQGLPKANANLAALLRETDFATTRYKEYDRYCELAAEQGELSAACNLGWRLLYKPTPGETIQTQRAVYWLQYAAAHGYVPAFNLVGWLYVDGHYVPKDEAEGERWFQKGAEVQDPWCELGLGMLELRSLQPDMKKARKWISKAAQQDCHKAWYRMGCLAELKDVPHEPGEKPNYQEAAQWYRRAAEKGNGTAAKRLATLAMEKKIDTGEDDLARLRKLADMQDKPALFELARRYLAGTAKPRSPSESPEALLELLADRQYPPAMLELADLYRTGKLSKKDPIRAIFLIHHSIFANEDSMDAYERFTNLRDANRQSTKLMPRNEGLESAFPLYTDALFNNKNPASTLKVARSYLDGTYPKDEASAAAWFVLAGIFQDPEGKTEGERLLNKLSPEEKRKANSIRFSLEQMHSRGMP